MKALQLDGFQFMNNDPGISYTSIGVNGAGLYTYLENKNFEEQQKKELESKQALKLEKLQEEKKEKEKKNMKDKE